MRENESQEAVFALSNEVENDLLEIRRLNDLAMWIEDARSYVQSVANSVECSGDFKAALRLRELHCLPSWEQENSEGLGALHRRIGRMARGVLQSVSAAVDDAKAAPFSGRMPP